VQVSGDEVVADLTADLTAEQDAAAVTTYL